MQSPEDSTFKPLGAAATQLQMLSILQRKNLYLRRKAGIPNLEEDLQMQFLELFHYLDLQLQDHKHNRKGHIRTFS